MIKIGLKLQRIPQRITFLQGLAAMNSEREATRISEPQFLIEGLEAMATSQQFRRYWLTFRQIIKKYGILKKKKKRFLFNSLLMLKTLKRLATPKPSISSWEWSSGWTCRYKSVRPV